MYETQARLANFRTGPSRLSRMLVFTRSTLSVSFGIPWVAVGIAGAAELRPNSDGIQDMVVIDFE